MKKLLTLSMLLFATVALSWGQDTKVQKLDFATFESLMTESEDSERNLAGDTPIVVEFSATWCEPCKAFAPVFDAVSLEYDGDVDFYTIDVDEEPELAKAFGITAVPSIMFFPVSGQLDKLEGAPDAEGLSNAIDAMFFE